MPVRNWLVDKKELGGLFGVGDRQIENLCTLHGMPKIKRPRSVRFDLRLVVPWFIQFKQRPTAYRDQVDAARARKLELETELLAKSVVDHNVFWKFAAQLTESVATRLEVMPARLSGELNEDQLKRLHDECRELRAQLAADVRGFDLSTDSGEADATAAESDDEPVGRARAPATRRRS